MKQIFYKIYYRKKYPDSNKIINVDPLNIKYRSVPPFKSQFPKHGTYIVGGDWDYIDHDTQIMYSNKYESILNKRKIIPIQNYGYYKCLQNHFIHDVEWCQTNFYKFLKERNPESERFSSPGKIEKRFNEIDDLYNKIKSEGYQSQKKIMGDNLSNTQNEPIDEVLISITRDGTLVFEEGFHRFTIARILQIPTIPVRIIVRHKYWQDTRNAFANIRSDKRLICGSDLHPDLAEFT